MNQSPHPQLKNTCRIGRFIRQNKLFRINGFTLLNYTDVGLAGVDFDFVAVVVIELGRCEVAGLFPGYMDTLAVCEVIELDFCGILAKYFNIYFIPWIIVRRTCICLLYTSDAADD